MAENQWLRFFRFLYHNSSEKFLFQRNERNSFCAHNCGFLIVLWWVVNRNASWEKCGFFRISKKMLFGIERSVWFTSMRYWHRRKICLSEIYMRRWKVWVKYKRSGTACDCLLSVIYPDLHFTLYSSLRSENMCIEKHGLLSRTSHLQVLSRNRKLFSVWRWQL